ncbi:MAG: tetratricopeptide repeat protein [Chloroflexota bacterium]
MIQQVGTDTAITIIQRGLAYWEPRLADRRDQPLAALNQQRSLFFTAISHGLRHKVSQHQAARLVLATFDLVERYHYWEEWLPLVETAVASCNQAHLDLKISLLNRLGYYHKLFYRLDTAAGCHNEALQLVERLAVDRPDLRGETHFYLGELSITRGEWPQAEAHSRQALSLFQQQPQAATWQAAALTSLGTIYQQQKKSLAKAEVYLLEAANIWQEAKRPVRAARVYGTLASVNITRQTYESAHTYLQQAFALIRKADLPVDEINFWVTLGLLHYEQAEWEEAERAFLQIVQPRLAQWATAYQMALTYNNLGNVLRQTGQYAEAQRYLYQAIAAWDAGGPALRQSADKGNSVGSLGEVHFDQQEWEKAAAAFETALDILQQQPPGNAWVESLIATFRAKLAQAAAKLTHTEHPTEH